MISFQAPAPARTALAVWGAGLVAYVVAVTGRTSLGVVGLEAAERFDISAAGLSMFVVIQLAVYAAAQVPVGIILDRVGSRALIAVGTVILAAGQLTLALADTLPLALLARVLVGIGDATAFVSVLRLIPSWFPVRRIPVLTQMTGIVGQTGQIISAVPFMALLHAEGWAPAFLSLAGLGVFTTILVLAVVRDAPTPQGVDRTTAVPTVRPGPEPLRRVLALPGTWLGFFTHFVSLFPTNTFMLLWGVPFLTAGQGMSAQAASALLTVAALTGIVGGPVIGTLQGRHPLRRSSLVVGTVALTIAVYASVLVPATPRPMAQLVLLVVVLSLSATAANVGFDFARSFVPSARLGTATGLVNVGGFVSSLAAIYLVGLVLDLVRPDGAYDLADFRLAFASQGLVWAVGLVGLVWSRRATRRRMATEGVVVPPVREVVARLRAEAPRRRRRRPGLAPTPEPREPSERDGGGEEV
ncbi:MFS transporter [Georgenia faecalis]|uniref:MFS transporter n=1 Tax=Georgenia faecalis TaxID=2483799 RepID=UPI001F493CFF|nr:MFS transporter [Georgenia faecalis]